MGGLRARNVTAAFWCGVLACLAGLAVGYSTADAAGGGADPGACGPSSNPCIVRSLKTTPVPFGSLPPCNAARRGQTQMTTDAGQRLCDGSWGAIGGAAASLPVSLLNDGGTYELKCASGATGGCSTYTGNKSWLLQGDLTLYGTSGSFSAVTVDATSFVQAPWIRSAYIQPTLSTGATLFGNRPLGDTTAGANVGNVTAQHEDDWDDAGTVYGVFQISNGTGTSGVCGVTASGQMGCGNQHSAASFVDGSGASGHVSLASTDGLYTVVQGQLNRCLPNVLPDGGCAPVVLPDAGVAEYGGLHGSVTFIEKHARDAGWSIGLIVPHAEGSASTSNDLRWYVSTHGAMGQNHGTALAAFPSATQQAIVTAQGQMFYGESESSMMYDFGGHRWYYSDGSAWTTMSGAPSSVVLATSNNDGLPFTGNNVDAILAPPRAYTVQSVAFGGVNGTGPDGGTVLWGIDNALDGGACKATFFCNHVCPDGGVACSIPMTGQCDFGANEVHLAFTTGPSTCSSNPAVAAPLVVWGSQ